MPCPLDLHERCRFSAGIGRWLSAQPFGHELPRFSLGLSFLIGASILKTMMSSQWDDFARLSAIIGVRTVLNLLLERSIRQGKSAQSGVIAS